MASYGQAQNFSPRLWIVFTTTIIAFIATMLASINLYLLEDSSPLTQAAYALSPLLRFSYDVVYLSALVSSVAFCAIVAYAITRSETTVTISLTLITLFIAFAGLGGLLLRQPTTFLVLFLAFVILALISQVIGRAVSRRFRARLGQRSAAILGGCVGIGIVFLVNTVALVLHTIILNPVSHALFMQGQIGDTHFSSLLIAMGVELLTFFIYLLSVGIAFRSASP
jgi:hypothetical protein